MAYALVQSVTGTINGAGSVTLTLPNPTTIGNQLIAQFAGATFPGVAFTVTMTDNKAGNTWTNDKTVTFANGPVDCATQISQTLLSAAGSGHTVTFTSSSGNTYAQVAVNEWSGATSTIDQTASNTASAASTSLTATTAATTNANDLLICVFSSNGVLSNNGQNSPANVNGSQTGVVSLYSVVDDSSINGIEASYKILSATGTQAVNYTYTSDAAGYGLAVVVYKAATGGGISVTGNTGTFSPGSVKANTAVGVSGVTGTFTAGTVTPGSQPNSIGALRRSGPGISPDSMQMFRARQPAFTAAASISITGVSGTFTVGTVKANTAIAFTGVTGNFTAGTVSVTTGVTLSGVSGTFTAANLTPNTVVGLIGVTGTFTPGTVSTATGGNVTVSINGVTGTFSPGNVTGQSVIALSGVTSTFNPGSVNISTSISLSGVLASFSAGTVTIAGSSYPIPTVVGETQSQAISDLVAAGFSVTVQTAYSFAVAAGIVISQDPMGYAPLGTEILIVVSLGDPSSMNWPLPSSITNLPARGAWELPSGQQALWVIGSNCYLMTVATAATASSRATFTLSKVGDLNTSTGPVSIRDNGVGGTAVIVDGPYGYYYTIATQAFARITDPAFLGATHVAFIDGWWIFNQPGTQVFYTPTSTYSTVFNGSNFALKDGATDNIEAIYENKEELWLIGAKTTEVWYDAGGQFFPFARLVSTMLQVGCAAKYSVCRFNSESEDGLIWLARSERGQNVVVKISGFAAEVISTPAVNNAIASYDIVSDAIGYSYQEDGHVFYVLTFPSTQNQWGGIGVTWVYDGSVGPEWGWHQRLAFEPYSGVWYRHRSNCFVNFQNQRLVGDFQNGSIYRLDRSVYTDDGWPLVGWRRAPHIWDGAARERVFMAFLQIEFSPGVGTSTGMGSDPQAILTISRDGGMTFGQEIRRGLGKIGEYLRRAIWRRLSFSRDGVVDMKIYDPVNRDIVGATLKKGENG